VNKKQQRIIASKYLKPVFSLAMLESFIDLFIHQQVQIHRGATHDYMQKNLQSHIGYKIANY
jgi:hypothetical protein